MPHIVREHGFEMFVLLPAIAQCEHVAVISDVQGNDDTSGCARGYSNGVARRCNHVPPLPQHLQPKSTLIALYSHLANASSL